MVDHIRCEHRIYKNWHEWRCQRNAKVEREGKHYCNQHDPVKVKERQAERLAAWEAKWESKQQDIEDAEAIQATIKKDAARYRWLTDDHADAVTRDYRSELLSRMSVMSYSAISSDIDAAISRTSPVIEEEVKK